jgi:hypothetical protein
MPLIYGEGKDSVFKRLREEIDKASKGKLLVMPFIKNKDILKS